MAETGLRAWRCGNCGYVHRGDRPTECPVCGAPAEDFAPFEEAPARLPEAASQWRCMNCNYVLSSAQAPSSCPVCHVPSDQFEPIAAINPQSSGNPGPYKAVIVGAGIAGVSAAEAMRAASPQAEITLVAGESALPYYRLNLTRFLAGEITLDSMPIHPAEWYRDNRVELLSGARAEAIDLAGRSVSVAGRGDVRFDRLVLAMGAHPFIPPIPGIETAGAVTLRTHEDAEGILAHARRGDPVVIVGGGVLGLETAGALARHGVSVTVLEGHDWLMPRQLDREAGGRLARHVTSLGIRLEKNAATKEITGTGRPEAVILGDGRKIPARVVIIAAGVRPNTHLARKAGLEVNQGVLVGNHLAASAEGTYAAGDVAEHNGVLYGTWAASQYQGAIAGMNAAGLDTLYGGQPRSNTLKVLGVDLMSIGVFEPADGSYRVIDEKSEDRYRRFVFHDGRLVGAILFGTEPRSAAVKMAIETKLDFSGLLLGTPSAQDIVDHAGAATA